MAYVEKEALLADIGETVLFSVRGGAEMPTPEMRGANKVIDRIKRAPAADVAEVRHGEWREEKEYYDDDYSECNVRKVFACSLCGRTEKRKEPYCNCGAKMGKGDA